MNQWQADFMIPAHLSLYIFLDDLPSQNWSFVWIVAGDEEQLRNSLLVLQCKVMSLRLEYQNHREALTVAEASVSSIQEFHVLSVVSVDYVLLCESKLSEKIVGTIGMEGMALGHKNVHSHNSSLCW